MSGEPLRVLLLSDANIANLGAALRADASAPSVSVVDAPFGVVVPTLLDAHATAWNHRPDLTVVWTRPESVLASVAATIDGRRVAEVEIDREVSAFADAVANAASRSRWTLVPTWVPSFGARGLGAVDLHDAAGLRAVLALANTRLVSALRGVPDCWVLDASAWMEFAGTARKDRRAWYAGKIPFPVPVFRAAARDIKALCRAAMGRARKLVVLDLDNTLWGGVVGETGPDGIRLGGHDPVGEAFRDFQLALKALTRRGVVLAIVSKNEESVALDAIRRHPEMVLRESDFADWRINWEDKATNVAEILESLRLGSDAAVFIDDQPAERARVAAALPDILVPDWPADPLCSVEALDKLACFDVVRVTQEDNARVESYAADRARRALRSSVASADEWLVELGVKVATEELSPENIARATQLLNKTNQMNLSTRRLTEKELASWAAEPSHVFLCVRVADRFSDFGLTGLISIEYSGARARLVDFLVSCRVMGRRVEETMLHAAVEHARRHDVERVVAVHQPTERNQPMLAFWRDRSGFHQVADGSFEWATTVAFPLPPGVALTSSVADTT